MILSPLCIPFNVESVFKRSVFQMPEVYGCVSKRLMIGNKLILAIIETLQERFPFLGQKISIFQMIHSVVYLMVLVNEWISHPKMRTIPTAQNVPFQNEQIDINQNGLNGRITFQLCG